MTNMEVPCGNQRIAMTDYNQAHGHHEKAHQQKSQQCGGPVKGTAVTTEASKTLETTHRPDMKGHHSNENHRSINQTEASIRRSSSLGLSLLSEFDFNDSLPPVPLREDGRQGEHEPSNVGPNYRPMVGSGTADAFEALRHDFYVQQQQQQQQQKIIARQKRRMSSLSFGSAKAPSNSYCSTNSTGHMNPSQRPFVDEDRQYEMLKLHHLNLMNEIQETALMLNLYEQKQLLRQQQEQARQIQELRHLEDQQRERPRQQHLSSHLPLPLAPVRSLQQGPSHYDSSMDARHGINEAGKRQDRCDDKEATNKRPKVDPSGTN